MHSYHNFAKISPFPTHFSTVLDQSDPEALLRFHHHHLERFLFLRPSKKIRSRHYKYWRWSGPHICLHFLVNCILLYWLLGLVWAEKVQICGLIKCWHVSQSVTRAWEQYGDQTFLRFCLFGSLLCWCKWWRWLLSAFLLWAHPPFFSTLISSHVEHNLKLNSECQTLVLIGSTVVTVLLACTHCNCIYMFKAYLHLNFHICVIFVFLLNCTDA